MEYSVWRQQEEVKGAFTACSTQPESIGCMGNCEWNWWWCIWKSVQGELIVCDLWISYFVLCSFFFKSWFCCYNIAYFKTRSEPYNMLIHGLSNDWKCCPGHPRDHITPGYKPWRQTFRRWTTDWTQHGDLPRMEDDGGSLWKRLCSSQGLGHDDNDAALNHGVSRLNVNWLRFIN